MLQNPVKCMKPVSNFSNVKSQLQKRLRKDHIIRTSLRSVGLFSSVSCYSDVKSTAGCFLWSLVDYDERDDFGETVFLRLTEAAISDLRASLQSQSVLSFQDHSPQMNSNQK